jgi:DNA-binding NtrC family response regulator
MSREGYFAEDFPCGHGVQNLNHPWVPEAQNLDLHSLRAQLASAVSPGGLIGVSPPMRMIHDLICKATDRLFPVLIVGETGTGKELVSALYS